MRAGFPLSDDVFSRALPSGSGLATSPPPAASARPSRSARAARHVLVLLEVNQPADTGSVCGQVVAAVGLDGRRVADFPARITGEPRTPSPVRAEPVRDNHAPETLLRNAQAYVEEHLHDSDLRVGDIAVAVHVSPRYLQLLFQGAGLTVSSYLQGRRLERSLVELSDPTGRAIRDVAVTSGFKDASHFARAFKRRFGVLPHHYRRAAAGARQQTWALASAV